MMHHYGDNTKQHPSDKLLNTPFQIRQTTLYPPKSYLLIIEQFVILNFPTALMRSNLGKCDKLFHKKNLFLYSDTLMPPHCSTHNHEYNK